MLASDKVGAFPHVGALMIAVTTSHPHALRSQQIFDSVRCHGLGFESWGDVSVVKWDPLLGRIKFDATVAGN